MISKRFSSSKKASKFSKRVLGMESLENRELLSINPLGYDGGDVVQTNSTFGTESDFSTEASIVAGTAGDAQITVTYTPTGTESYTTKVFTGGKTGTDVTSSVTVSANGNGTASDTTPITITISGLTNGTAYTVVVNDGTTDYDVTMTPVAAAPTGDAVTNSVGSTSGVTSGAATVNWTKPTQYIPATGDPVALKGAGNYTLTVYKAGVAVETFDAATVKTKTSWVVTGLEADVEYTYTVEAELTAKNSSDTVPSGQQVVAAGTFKTEAAGAAADVTVGPPTDVKVAFTAKTSTYKVTWKAPANYTGGYKVIFHNTADGTTTTSDVVVPIAAGAKLQTEVLVSQLTVDKQYSITVVADVASTGAAISSTPTFVNVGTVTPAASTPPGAITSASASKGSANVSGGTTVTITPTAAATGTTKTVGYYVGLTAAADTVTDAEKAAMFYVAGNADGTTAVTVNLVGVVDKYVTVYAVAADGTLSADAKSSAVLAADGNMNAVTTADPSAPAATKAVVKADTTTKNKVTLTWTAGTDVDPTGDKFIAGAVQYKIQGYLVSYQVKGSNNWISTYVSGQSTATATIEGLAWATDYEFKVEAVVYKDTAYDDSGTIKWTATPTAVIANAAKATLKTAAAPAVVAPGKVEIDTVNTGTSMKVKWAAATGAAGYTVTLKDANKAVLATFTVDSTATSITFAKAATPSAAGDLAFDLTPGMKYTVEVQAMGTIPGSLSKASSATLTAAAYPLATVKDAKATGITDLSVTITAASKGVEANSQYYYVEYTNVVDAKGKADWNAAKVVSYAANSTDGNFMLGDPQAFATGATVKIEGLNPGTQYFVRVVAVDQQITSKSGSEKGWDDVTRVATGKEAKIKTVAVPLATIAKSGYAMSNTDFGFMFSGKDPNMNDKKDDLRASTTFTYKLLVSAVSTVDKATGKLNGAEEITGLIITNGTDAKGNDLFTSSIVKFSDLVTKGFKLEQLKSLNFQLEVTYTAAGDSYATTYTKVSKLTLPKWFV